MNIREYKTEVANNQRLRFYELSICIKEIFVAFPSLNGHYQFLKLVVLYCRPVFDSCLVSVHRMHGVIEELCDSLTVVDAQAYECKDTHLWSEGMIIGRYSSVLLLEEFIVTCHEVGEQFEECLVEGFVHVFPLCIEGRQFHHRTKVVELPGCNFAVDGEEKLLEFGDVFCLRIERTTDVCVLNLVVLFQQAIGLLQHVQLTGYRLTGFC